MAESSEDVQILPEADPLKEDEQDWYCQTVEKGKRVRKPCKICPNKEFKNDKHWELHMKVVHDEERPYKCKKCDAKLSELSSFKDHNKRYHTREFQYMCQLCGKHYVAMGPLKYHLKTFHKDSKSDEEEDESQLVHCGKCEKSYKSVKNLKVHMKAKHSKAK